jgi:CP family cyanate transporter-like MFS transporter
MPRLSWVILGLAALLGFAMWAPMFCIPPMEHILKGELLLTHTQTSFLFAIPNLMIIAVAIPAGIVADRIGVQKAIGIGITLIAIGAMLRGMTDSAVSLQGYTFVYGVGVGWLFPNLPKLVSLSLPREKLEVGTAVYSVGMYIGTALPLAITMSVVFPVVESFRVVFLVWSIPAVIGAIMWWALSKKTSVLSKDDKPGEVSKGNFTKLLMNRNLLLVASLFLIHQFFFNNWSGWAPALLLSRGATAELAGLISSITLWVGIPTGILMPRLFQKLKSKKSVLWISSLTTALVAAGALGMNLALSWVIMVLAGVAITSRFITLMTLPVEFVSAEEVGAASGLMLSIGYVGGIVGPLIGGYTFDLTGRLDLMLFTLVGVSVAAIVISLKLRETRQKIGTLR